MRHVSLGTLIGVALVVAPLTPLAAQDAREGALLYAEACSACHGLSLQGDGPMAGALTQRPADLTELAEDGDFPILEVARQIDGRDPLLAHGGEMPIYGAAFQGQGADVAMAGPGGQPILMSRPIADLIAFLRGAQQ